MSVATCSSNPSDLNAEHVCCTSDTCNHLDVSNAVASVIASMPGSCYVEHMDLLVSKQDIEALRTVYQATTKNTSDEMRAKGYLASAMMAILKKPATEMLTKALTKNLANLKRLERSVDAPRTAMSSLFTSNTRRESKRERTITKDANELGERLTASCDRSRAILEAEVRAC